MYLFLAYLFLGIFIICVLYPLLYVVSCSFSDPEALVQGKVFFFPVKPGLQGYKAVFQNTKIWRGYGNTILYTVVGTVVGVAVSMTAAYVLSRKEFPLHKFLSGFFMFTMFFGGGTIPTYLCSHQFRRSFLKRSVWTGEIIFSIFLKLSFRFRSQYWQYWL